MSDETTLLVCIGLLLVFNWLSAFLEKIPLPKERMKIDEALKMMDEAVGEGHLYGAPSVVYPGLSAMQALRFVLEGFLASFPDDQEARDTMRVHPRVEVRIRQVCVNRIRKGEPPADESIAAIFFMSHPEDRPDEKFKVPLLLPEKTGEEHDPMPDTGRRKFI